MLDLSEHTVFVAGGTGLGGSAVLRALLAANPDVRAIVPHRGTDGAFIRDPRITYVQADLCDREQSSAAVRGCTMAVMAAATTGGARASADAPWAQVTDNVVMDARMLEAFHLNHVQRVVYVSTASAYQPFEGAIREDELDWNQDPHDAHLGVGWVKRYGEKACWFWHRKTGIEAIILRLANVFGPYARFDPAVSNFIPALIRKAVDRADPFEVWGSPDVTRDVVYADDFGDAVVAALRHDEIKFDVFNIGSGVRTTVGDATRWVLDAAGHSAVQPVFGESPAAALTCRALDVLKARNSLGWRAQFGVEEGIRQTVEWWKGNKDTWLR